MTFVILDDKFDTQIIFSNLTSGIALNWRLHFALKCQILVLTLQMTLHLRCPNESVNSISLDRSLDELSNDISYVRFWCVTNEKWVFKIWRAGECRPTELAYHRSDLIQHFIWPFYHQALTYCILLERYFKELSNNISFTRFRSVTKKTWSFKIRCAGERWSI